MAPQLVTDPYLSFRVALHAERVGLDGVFVFDHLVPPSREAGPSLAQLPLLAAIVAGTSRLEVGTLVLRVGVVPLTWLSMQVDALRRIAGERVIFGLGIGDAAGRRENEMYGVSYASRSELVELLTETCTVLSGKGSEVWIGGRSASLVDLASRLHVTSNLWHVGDDLITQPATADVTWAGRALDDTSPDALAAKIDRIGDAGFRWAVFLVSGVADDPEGAVESLARAASTSRQRRMTGR